MPDSLPVRLNDDGLHDIRTPTSFEATDAFSILLQNGDAPVHVHLRLDDALSSVATVPANNHYLDRDSTRRVSVEVAEDPRPVEGRLEIVTGHGAETDFVAVSIAQPDEEETVAIDESLATPIRNESDDDSDDEGEDDESGGVELPDLSLRQNAPVAVLGVLAVAAAAGSATLSSSVAVLLGALAVLGSVAAAGYLLVR